MANDGVIDKFIGDAMMVVFGAPAHKPPEQSALSAARCAVGMRRALVELNEELEAQGLPRVRIGMGIHTGEAIVGNVGSAERMDYTCIGDSVNTTARIESACKQVGTDLLVSGVVRDLLGDNVQVGEPAQVSLKGKRAPMAVYPLIDAVER